MWIILNENCRKSTKNRGKKSKIIMKITKENKMEIIVQVRKSMAWTLQNCIVVYGGPKILSMSTNVQMREPQMFLRRQDKALGSRLSLPALALALALGSGSGSGSGPGSLVSTDGSSRSASLLVDFKATGPCMPSQKKAHSFTLLLSYPSARYHIRIEIQDAQPRRLCS